MPTTSEASPFLHFVMAKLKLHHDHPPAAYPELMVVRTHEEQTLLGYIFECMALLDEIIHITYLHETDFHNRS
jgi:hypothetical protein